jgi:phage/plasmid-like protein (TIGR03299 family)
MSANIEQFADGTASFFSARQPAWHKLGVITPDALTAQDALQTAQLDWQVKVSESPVSVDVNGTKISVQDKFLTYRDHPKTGLNALGVVGNRYTPIQNNEAFEFLNYLADESGAVFETAGSLGKGERVFMTMKFPESMSLANGADLVDHYILAVNSHDGTTSFQVAVTPIRVVCQNTVRLGLARATNKISLRHTANAAQKVQQARETLGLMFKYQDEFQKEVDKLLAIDISDNDFNQFVESLIPLPARKDATEREINTVWRKRDEIGELWKAPTQANVANTAWAAYNAVVEWSDWSKRIRGGEDKDALRAERLILGIGEEIKDKAHALLVA